MKILVDVKNLALYSGGIAHWIRPLLTSWVAFRKSQNGFVFLYPISPNLKEVNIKGGSDVTIKWPTFLPRNLRHPWYDGWQFSRALKEIAPQFLFSPYHDVRVPIKSSSLYVVISVLDLCFLDVPQSYPFFIRHYYSLMLRINVPRAHHILTISEATKHRLMEEFHIPARMISIIPNAIESQFLDSIPVPQTIAQWRAKYIGSNAKIALYSSGIEYRKNMERLLTAFRLLWLQGNQVILCITGRLNSQWQHLFLDEEIKSGKIQFTGFLSLEELRLAYAASDCVVFPSLCEGFGRACIEAMVCGVPLACSDLPVFHEVAGDYAHYFDPLDVVEMAHVIAQALDQGSHTPRDSAPYRVEVAQSQFIEVMDELIDEAKLLSAKID